MTVTPARSPGAVPRVPAADHRFAPDEATEHDVIVTAGGVVSGAAVVVVVVVVLVVVVLVGVVLVGAVDEVGGALDATARVQVPVMTKL